MKETDYLKIPNKCIILYIFSFFPYISIPFYCHLEHGFSNTGPKPYSGSPKCYLVQKMYVQEEKKSRCVIVYVCSVISLLPFGLQQCLIDFICFLLTFISCCQCYLDISFSFTINIVSLTQLLELTLVYQHSQKHVIGCLCLSRIPLKKRSWFLDEMSLYLNTC